jgi:hypothetical protein
LAVSQIVTAVAGEELERRRGADEALLELLDGLRDGADLDTPPLEAQAGGPLRVRELLTGVGGRQ